MSIVHRLVEEEKDVVAFVRNRPRQGERGADRAKRLFPDSPLLTVVEGDANDTKSVVEACSSADVIYHCVNVPYSRWEEFMPQITANILRGAKESEARLVFPGNVYNYGRFRSIPVNEEHPKLAHTRKGQLRIVLETSLMGAHKSGYVPVVIVRLPDFYGPNVTNRLMASIFEAVLNGKKARWPGKPDVVHDLVFIKDAARAVTFLAGQDEAYGQSWHVPGAGPITGREFITKVFEAAGKKPKVGAMPRLLVKFAALFDAEAYEFYEMLYQFEEPYLLDGDKYTSTFGPYPSTPYDEGIKETLEWFRAMQQSSLQTR